MDDEVASYKVFIDAIKKNDHAKVERLLCFINPNIVDERKWSGLHEAAARNSFECFKLLLDHPECDPLVTTQGGENVLFVACENRASLKLIELLLKKCRNIVNGACFHDITPLHMAAMSLNADYIQMFLDYGADIDAQTRDGETPLLKACFNSLQNLDKSINVTNMLLHAGADHAKANRKCVTPVHISCHLGFVELIRVLMPFIGDINDRGSLDGCTPLMCAVESPDVISVLLENGADPNLLNLKNETALDIAINRGCLDSALILMKVTSRISMDREIILNICKCNMFSIDVLDSVLNLELGPEFFDFNEIIYTSIDDAGPIHVRYPLKSPLDSFLQICESVYRAAPDRFEEFFYRFLMRGASVNGTGLECPPLIYLHICDHSQCFDKVFEILLEHGCNVDVRANKVLLYGEYYLPDVFSVALTVDPSTIPKMVPYSLQCEPSVLLQFAHDHGLIDKMPPSVQEQLLKKIGVDVVNVDYLSTIVPPLKHLCRMKIRCLLRKTGIKTTMNYLNALKKLCLPLIIENYLRYF